MTATLLPESKSSSRRALLTGALGGIGAWVASSFGRADRADAATGDTVHVGDNLTATTSTRITNLTSGQAVFLCQSSTGAALYGLCSSYYAVVGTSGSFVGVYGGSTSYIGVQGKNAAAGEPAIQGHAEGDSTGVQGFSGGGTPPAARAKTGVYGYADQDGDARGVWGETTGGRAIQGTATSGYAGYFSGKVYTDEFYEMAETSNPSAPGASRARLFARENGSGKTELCVRFNTGGTLVIKTQP